MNYFEHHIGDYDQATAHLSACEDGIYSRLIRWYMADEKPLPADLKAIQRRVRAHTKDERQAVETVLGEFFELQENGYHQRRCDAEIARYQDKQRKARASAEARWSKSERNANASETHDAQDMRTHSERNANGMHRAPVPRHQTPSTIPSDVEHPQVDSPGGSTRPSRVLKAKDLVAEGVDPGAADDWLAVRKAKKAVLTQTAWDAVKREAEEAGLTPAQAVKVAAERNWQGFKATWLQRDAASHHTDDVFAGSR